LSFFPSTFCAFEVIVLLRCTFFMCFNIMNAYALCFVVDPTNEKLWKSSQSMNTQFEINRKMTELYNMKSDCKEL
jgi:hypothetical protein